jgi:hypothetical protein
MGIIFVADREPNLWSDDMSRKIIRQGICVILIFCLLGCNSAYDLNLYSSPSGAYVKIGSKVYGQTPCNVKIPAKSDQIDDHHIDITYSLEDGRSMTKTYNLKHYKPPNQMATIRGASIAAPGVLGFALTETDEDDEHTSFDEDDSNRTKLEIRLVSLGLIGIGALICYAFGGSFTSGGEDIYETFED